MNEYIQREAVSTKEVNLLLEVSFHEILVQQLGFDPYEVDDIEKEDENGNGMNGNRDEDKGIVLLMMITVIMVIKMTEIVMMRHIFQLQIQIMK